MNAVDVEPWYLRAEGPVEHDASAGRRLRMVYEREYLGPALAGDPVTNRTWIAGIVGVRSLPRVDLRNRRWSSTHGARGSCGRDDLRCPRMVTSHAAIS